MFITRISYPYFGGGGGGGGGWGGGGGGVSGGREGGAFLNNKTKYHCFRLSVNRRVLFFLREGKERGEEFISTPGS